MAAENNEILSGIFCVWKPKGPTSHDVVNKLRKITGEKRIGHAGTLDPLAEGVLVVAVGRENTKKLSELVKKEKEYIAEIKLGEESDTDDEEGKKQIFNFQGSIFKEPKTAGIKKILKNFLGKIEQIPPKFSAVKIGGKKAYEEARGGRELKLKPREVEIKDIKLLDYEWPLLKIKVVTGPGVYIRALARDIGKKLGCGAYLANLTRTRVGDYEKKDCRDIK